MAERDPRAPRIRPVRTVNHVRPDYGGNVDVAGYDDSGLVDRVVDLEARTAGHIVRDEGSDLPQRPWLDFVGEGVTVTDFGGVTRVSIPGGVNGASGGRGSHIDLFVGITDDTVDEFVLTYAPVDRSWNVDLNGITQHNVTDYTVDGQTLTVTDPTDLFRGASETDEWALQVQYDKASDLLTPEPEPPGEATPLMVDPFAWYRLEETSGTTLADSSGNGRDMTIEDTGPTFSQPGVVDNGVLWGSGEGSAQYSAAQYSHSTASVECWVKLSAYPAAATGVIGYAQDGHGSTTHDKNLYIRSDGKVGWYVSNGSPQDLISPSALALDTWHHLAATVGPDGTVLYVDGAAVDSDPAVTTSFTGSPQNLVLRGGGTNAGGATATLGTGAMVMDEAAFYITQISASYVSGHWEAGQ